MQWSDLWTAFAMVLIIEGILPFVSPEAFKRYAASLQELPEGSIRRFGLIMMVIGLLTLIFVRQ